MVKGGKERSHEIFVCDYCNMFEGRYGDVVKHEKACKRYFDELCKRAGTYVDERAGKIEPVPDVEQRADAATPTAKEKREVAKKRRR